jgi:DNA-directed RNA polymerase specialized sigma24 family protein
MSISTQITSHLPNLRRFARALTGSQSGGDAYVAMTLETILADASSFPAHDDPRVALYQLFLKVWNSATINTKPQAGEHTNGTQFAVARNLAAITPRPRQVFLLVSVEGFTPEQAAIILETDLGSVSNLLAQAGREIAEQVATDILIIEDEPIIAMDLEGLVESLGHRVMKVARTHKEAIAAVREKRPGLVLADIQLADGSSGLDAVNEIVEAFNVPVIFITAYPDQLLTGKRPEPTFLITKPFETNAVKAIVSQALFFDTKAQRRDGLATSNPTTMGPQATSSGVEH